MHTGWFATESMSLSYNFGLGDFHQCNFVLSSPRSAYTLYIFLYIYNLLLLYYILLYIYISIYLCLYIYICDKVTMMAINKHAKFAFRKVLLSSLVRQRGDQLGNYVTKILVNLFSSVRQENNSKRKDLYQERCNCKRDSVPFAATRKSYVSGPVKHQTAGVY